MPTKQTKNFTDEDKILLEHAWNHFSYHANQRLVTFRFYVFLIAVIAGIYFNFLGTEKTISVAASVLGLFISFLFYLLDMRNVQLIELSEQVVSIQQKKLSSLTNIEEVRIIEKSDSIKKFPSEKFGIRVSYGSVFAKLFWVAMTMSLVGCFVATIGTTQIKQWISCVAN